MKCMQPAFTDRSNGNVGVVEFCLLNLSRTEICAPVEVKGFFWGSLSAL